MKRLLAVLLAVAVFGCSAKENEYQGKPVSFWIANMDQGTPKAKANVGNLLVQAGQADATVVKALIRALKNGSFTAADLLARIGPAVGEQTNDVVAALGAEIMVKGNGRNSLRLACARALPKFGTATKEAVPALLDMLKDDDPVLRAQAAKTLGLLPVGAAAEARDALLAAARTDKVLEVQQNAIESLKVIDPAAIEPP